MKIIERTESKERCAEAGWFAFHYQLDEKITEPFILSLRPLGSFLYMRKLARPFFKIESDYYMIKGLLNDDFFRVAVHTQHYDELEKIEKQISTFTSNTMQTQ